MSSVSPESARHLPTARVFFALWPSAELAARLAEIARQAAAQYGGRPTRLETLHLTLAFLGDVPESRLPELEAAARSVAAESFDLRLDRFGFWQHNILLWAGCTQVPEMLSKLVEKLQRELAAAGFPGAAARNAFSPHVTLVRRLPAASRNQLTEALPEFPGLDWPCRRFVLVRSQRLSSGPHYERIGEYLLG